MSHGQQTPFSDVLDVARNTVNAGKLSRSLPLASSRKALHRPGITEFELRFDIFFANGRRASNHPQAGKQMLVPATPAPFSRGALPPLV
jgi:hypothetical protein